MSSDQFSENPLPPADRHCPLCGEPITANAKMCWLCFEQVAHAAGPGANAMPETRVSSDDTALLRTLAWLGVSFVAVTIAAVLALEVPGVLILILMVAAPFLAWMFLSEGLRITRAAGRSTERDVGTSMAFTCCAIFVGTSAIIAFCMYCSRGLL